MSSNFVNTIGSVAAKKIDSISNTTWIWITAAISMTIGVFAISGESLWIDEANSAVIATAPYLKVWEKLMVVGGSTLQMPLYVLWLSLWEKIGDSTEIWLRAANIPWLILGCSSVMWAMRQFRLQALFFLTLFLTQPFLWYYLNEVRPYAMQISGGCLLLSFFISRKHEPENKVWMWFLCWGGVVTAASSMLGALIIPVIGIMFLLPQNFSLVCFSIKKSPKPFLIFIITIGILGAYYMWTLYIGVGGAKLWRVTSANILFALYELVGFSGYGPSRNKLRELGISGTNSVLIELRQYLFGLGLYAFIFVSACAFSVVAFFRKRQTLLLSLLFIAVGYSAILIGLSLIVKWPFWGRHFAPIFPIYIFILSASLALACKYYFLSRWLAAGLTILAITSSLNLRFNPEYHKDDYRSAAQAAMQYLDSAKVVWWIAEKTGAEYYNIPITNENFILMHSPSLSNLRETHNPQIVIMSKPDVYDRQGIVSNYIKKNNFKEKDRFNSFIIWEKAD